MKKYPENSLCILKRGKETHVIGHTDYNRRSHYRVSFDPDGMGCIVYGEWMSIENFEKDFELYIPVLHERLAALNLIDGDKPISFKAFKERADDHTYTGNRIKRKVVYVGTPKENLFAFYPYGSTKTDALKESYNLYLALVKGDWEGVDQKFIAWGNSGYPLSYNRIYYR